ncbi:MAG: hypothetical protein ABS54_12000 [Hyphomicrobium sp. SCN 65-11]|nr:MAG: hypothetical protein ABS54_12000 [Hyphomicrobium sp. SCN 65-11]
MLKVPLDINEDAQIHNHRISGPTGELLLVERSRWFEQIPGQTRVIVGMDEKIIDSEMRRFNGALLWTLGGFATSLGVAASLLLAFAMKPFGALRQALARVRTGSASALGGSFPSEVQPLIDDLNNLLSSSGEQMVRARAQAGNLAHGLKTSLAILVDESNRLAKKGEVSSAAVLLDQTKRMQRQIDYQIARARAAGSRKRIQQATLLARTANEVVTALERLYCDRNLIIENNVANAAIHIACEAEDLEEMLGNVLDNACKFAKSRVRLDIAQSGPRELVSIAVDDDGPGLPPEAWDMVLNVGVQWENSNGSGLGLAIVRDVAQLYGGFVQLDQSDLGGLRVTIELPMYEG